MEVKARAPGKIILAGEHAVVHGSTAVAASVDLYTTASVRLPSSSDENDIVKLHLKDLELEFSWPVSRVREALGVFVGAISSPTTCPAECLKSIASLVEDQNIPEAKIGLASGVAAFLWLCSSILGFVPVEVAITSELPLGSGLGSSAAFCVALSAALLALSGSVNVDREHHGWMVYKEDELDLLNKWAFEGEKIIHGKPSGIDNTVSTYDGETTITTTILKYIEGIIQDKAATAIKTEGSPSVATGTDLAIEMMTGEPKTDRRNDDNKTFDRSKFKKDEQESFKSWDDLKEKMLTRFQMIRDGTLVGRFLTIKQETTVGISELVRQVLSSDGFSADSGARRAFMNELSHG
ncbi:mevalonate kinase-like [Cucumis melo var. makuwa]|uniref:mevalonate kinase n=1 Tax=Cucumis melo var. makuwa TaxID=1194695 RepID=A0A5A7U144_CUCMM|nr:mevalonate kinase-like [Cucumis melo var. makuwa]